MRGSKHIAGFGAFALVAACACAINATPASATSLLLNGNFEGAVYDFTDGNPSSGQAAKPPFGFSSHTYLLNYPWSNSGSGALDWIAGSGGQVIPYAPANPSGYKGNVYVADASSQYNVGTYLQQTVSGLTPGQTYHVVFQQAAGDYYNNSPTDTAQWLVGFGGNVSYVNDQWVLSSDAVQKASSTMAIDQNGTSPWMKQSLSFTASSTSELLTFFASGSGAPPFALLADVSVSAAPEPASWIMMIGGFGFVGFSLRRRRLAAAGTQRAN